MLAQIHVQNIALIDEVTVDLGEQLNILTGETGAGKSILLGAINLALGARSAKDVVRDPNQPAGAELLFIEQNPTVLAGLQEMGLEAPDGEILISRRFGSNGKGVSRINGQTVVASQVKQVAAMLLDVHGQHEHQSLLNPASHIEILDRFSPEIAPLRDTMKKQWNASKELESELARYTANEQEKERLLALMQYESDEIADAALQEGEEERLQDERKRLLYSERLREDSLSAYEALRAGEEACASDCLSTAIGKLESMERMDPAFATERVERLRDALSVVEDIATDLRDYGENVDSDENRLNTIEERLDQISRLKSKYGSSIAEIKQYKEKNDQEIQKLLHISETIATLRQQEKELRTAMEKTAASLGRIRRTWGERVSGEITEILKTLQFEDPAFQIQIEDKELSASGADQVTFMIRTNVGEAIKPLTKVASGGELSRVMLAIKTVLAQQDEIGTLIFDEIDTGISGRTAQSVAEKMSRIAQYRQVIAVTHLPQIAAMADVHLRIEKSAENGRTHTDVVRLDAEESVQEIARLLGGREVTETVLQNALEMKKLAENWKKKERV